MTDTQDYWQSLEEISSGIEVERLVSWIANEYRDGAIQAYFTETELENGAHYDEAKTCLQEAPAHFINEYMKAQPVTEKG